MIKILIEPQTMEALLTDDDGVTHRRMKVVNISETIAFLSEIFDQLLAQPSPPVASIQATDEEGKRINEEW